MPELIYWLIDRLCVKLISTPLLPLKPIPQQALWLGLWLGHVWLGWAGLVSLPVRAEVGVGPRSILVGQSAAFSGPSAQQSLEFRAGAHEVFEQVNARGGIHGRQLVMVYRDDRLDPALARRNTERFIKGDKVFALFGYFSTPTVQAVLPLIEQARVPLIAPLSGAQLLRLPVNPLIFNIRASYH